MSPARACSLSSAEDVEQNRINREDEMLNRPQFKVTAWSLLFVSILARFVSVGLAIAVMVTYKAPDFGVSAYSYKPVVSTERQVTKEEIGIEGETGKEKENMCLQLTLTKTPI